MVVRTDVGEKSKRLAVAAKKRVLSVIDPLACLTIGKCRGSAAEPRRLLEYGHAPAGCRETDAGRETSEAGAENGDVSAIGDGHFSGWSTRRRARGLPGAAAVRG